MAKITGAQAMGRYQNRFFQRQIGAIFATPDGKPYKPDFVAMARAYGTDGVRADRPEQIRSSVTRQREDIHVSRLES